MPQRYSLIIKGGVIVDGTGSPPFRADIGVKGDTIAKIGDLTGSSAERIIDASGLIVTPGFIDIHNHSDLGIFAVPTADNYIRQGVTTLVVGNCGFSPAPITELNRDHIEKMLRSLGVEEQAGWETYPEYLDALDKLEKSINVAPLIGHNTIRGAVMGLEDRRPTRRELREMRRIVQEALRAGAHGLSTGLIYIPGVYAGTEEIIELAKPVGRVGGLYATHMRNEGEMIIDAVTEAIRIGLESGARVEISHLKVSGRANWGKMDTVLGIIEDYARRMYDVSADAYAYTASSTSLTAALPPWAVEGGAGKLVERLKNPEERERIRREIEREGLMSGRRLFWDDLSISYSPSHPEYEGRKISTLAEEQEIDPFDLVVSLLIEDEAGTGIIIHGMMEEEVRQAISHPLVAISSDGSVKKPGRGKPHPRNYGAFPRIIAKYVREERVLSLPEAVRKMTSLPARKMRLWDRGILRPGMKADIVVFNYHTIKDTATFSNPHSYPKGIYYVIVNGAIVVDEEKHTGAKPGRLLRRR